MKYDKNLNAIKFHWLWMLVEYLKIKIWKS